MGPRSDSPVLAPIAGEAMGPPLGQPHFVLGGRKDVSTGSRFRAKRGGPVLAPIAGEAMGPRRDSQGQPPWLRSARSTGRMGENTFFRNDNFGTFGLSGPAWLAVGRAPLSGCRC